MIQTGLYRLSEEWLDLLMAGGFEAVVSFDLTPGVRLSAGGRPTERRVAANLDRLLAAGVPAVGAVVLASHTENRLTEIHDVRREGDAVSR